MSNAMINVCDETLELRSQMDTSGGKTHTHTSTHSYTKVYTHTHKKNHTLALFTHIQEIRSKTFE